MAWAIFNRAVHMNGTQRVPKSKYGFMASAAPVPQEFPLDFIEFAVARGAAERVPSPSKSGKRAIKRNTEAE